MTEESERAWMSAVPSRRPLASARRPQILAAAVEVLRERGLASVRVSDVAERAGTSPAAVIYYFGTKDELFKAAIADVDAAFYSRVWVELEQIEAGVQRLASLMVRSSFSDWILWMDLWVHARRHPELLATRRAFADRWCVTIADVVRHGQARGEFAPVDADEVGVRLGALTNGLAVQMVLEDPGRTREHYVRMALTAAAAELGCELEALLAAAAAVFTGPPEDDD
jgi:AcrR family transcriptional regulator